MKTTFSNPLKIKKEIVKEIERELINKRQSRENLLKEIETIDNKISNFKFPTEGSISLLQLSKESFALFNEQKDKLKYNLVKIEQNINTLNIQYKEANIEYEKILYLHKEEIRRFKKELKLKEDKMMDEVANILFERSKKG